MSNISLSIEHYLIFNAVIFFLSLTGIVINRANLLTLLMSIELMLLSVSANFVVFSVFWNHNTGNIFVFFILTVAAAESAIGLAIVTSLFKSAKTIAISKLNALKG